MPEGVHFEGTVRRSGFTLIELLVAVTLLIMLLWGTSHIFDITVRAMDETTAINEMTADSPHFYDRMRKDIRGLETNGYLILGQRTVSGYASHRMANLGRNTTFRCDWMVMLVNTETASNLDMNVVGQWARIFWGHGPRTGSTGTGNISHSQFATDWTVMRHQILLLSLNPGTVEDMNTNAPGMYSGIESSQNYPFTASNNNASSYGHVYQQAIKSLYGRIPRWYGPTSNWASIPMVDGYLGYDETAYWHDYLALIKYNPMTVARFHALPHCGTFQVQYALAGDLRAGSGGTVLWHDPILNGRTVFQAGDAWPVLLKVTTQVFDPKDRLEKGRTFVAIVPVAR